MRTNYAGSKDLVQKTISDKILEERAYEVDRNPNYNGYQRRLATIIYEIFDNKAESGAKASVYEDLDQELHKTVIKKFKKKKVYARFKDIIQAANLAEMGSLSSKNRGV